MKVLVTGAAGFIGTHTSLRFLERGDDVIGVGNLNDYYYDEPKGGTACAAHTLTQVQVLQNERGGS